VYNPPAARAEAEAPCGREQACEVPRQFQYEGSLTQRRRGAERRKAVPGSSAPWRLCVRIPISGLGGWVARRATPSWSVIRCREPQISGDGDQQDHAGQRCLRVLARPTLKRVRTKTCSLTLINSSNVTNPARGNAAATVAQPLFFQALASTKEDGRRLQKTFARKAARP